MGEEQMVGYEKGAVCAGVPHIDGGEHVLWVDQGPEQAHQLNSTSQLRVRVTDHLFYDHVDQQHVLGSREQSGDTPHTTAHSQTH